MNVHGIEIELDVHDYLVAKGLGRIRPVGWNVMACCPFHNEHSPSFGVHKETGQYHCFGCGAKGSIAQLVKELDGFDTVFDAEQFLIARFGRYSTDTFSPLEIDLDGRRDPLLEYVLDEAIMTSYRFRHPYLENRGITEKWQRVFEIGYSETHAAITIPWRDESGKLLTVKMRSVLGKQFWYEPPMPPGLKGRTWFGLDKILKWGIRKVAITEAEIDCMSVWQSEHRLDGQAVGAIAIGGNQPTFLQAAKLIRLLPDDVELIVFTDNDEGGDVSRRIIAERLGGRYSISEIDWAQVSSGSVKPKDANDLTIPQRRHLLDVRIPQGLHLGFE